MNERRFAEAEHDHRHEEGAPCGPDAGDDPLCSPPRVTQSCVLRVPRAGRPSWDEVDEYLLSGSHREQVEGYARRDPAFAEVLRWMRNEREEAEIDTAPPSSSNVRYLTPRASVDGRGSAGTSPASPQTAPEPCQTGDERCHD
jgi:hypothetical protein